MPKSLNSSLVAVTRALVALGKIKEPLKERVKAGERFGHPDIEAGVSVGWLEWCQRWKRTSTYAVRTRNGIYYQLLKVGRWLADMHPEINSPAQWTRELAAEYVAAIDRMKIGYRPHEDRRVVARRAIMRPAQNRQTTDGAIQERRFKRAANVLSVLL